MSSLFGLDQSSRLVFVSEVPRGLACQCRCVACNEPLIARQGEVREHHFAHASGREPCDVSHESLLHRYAKQVIQEAGGLVVPMNATVALHLGLPGSHHESVHLELPKIDVEQTVRGVRPDLLGHTALGLGVAVEVAYSSFCDMFKVAQFEAMALPVLEIDLRAFTPEGFEPNAVRSAVLNQVTNKAWLWPIPERTTDQKNPDPLAPVAPAGNSGRVQRAPEEILMIAGRMVSMKTLPSGDLAVRVVAYDPDLVSMIKSIAQANHGRYVAKWRTWNVPRWRVDAVRAALRQNARSVSIVMQQNDL